MLAPLDKAKDYFDKKTEVLGGTRVFKGTRIPVDRIVFLVQEEKFLPEKLVEEFPKLSIEDIYYALWYVTKRK